MTGSQLLGWLKRAYSGKLEIRKTTARDSEFDYLFDDLTRPGRTPAGLRKDGRVEFAGEGKIWMDEEERVVSNFIRLFGYPAVEFESKISKSEEPKPKAEEPKPKAEEPKPKAEEPKPEEKKFTIYNGKDEIIKEIRAKKIPALEEEKLAGGAIVIKAGDVEGPVIYDYGISPDKKRRHIFIPYSSKEEVKNILNNFYKQTKTL